MTKTAPLTDDTHERLKEIQETLRDRRNISMTLKDIITIMVPDRETAFNAIIDSIKRVSDKSEDIATGDIKLEKHGGNGSKHGGMMLLEEADMKT